ncbi:T9SS type A sorting domain-containing protein [Marinoscillum sp. 108]|uniref:T9SS type A sorting domain-containing protein n=1 Tax=Marinoscillum sp. 108 TaxID=2653151 RepID=UPI0012F01216|nr:T9SS type A sorting domain-containing protein [Marinoscillum sp. 108]VXD15923.1 hypothetical protein MARINOS108_110085 [Marinoscillum sp. 108]
MKLLIYILKMTIISIALLSIREAKSQTNTSDSLALVVLYNSTNGPSWTNSNNWLAGSVDTWHGVTVSGGRVVSLDLSDDGTLSYNGNNLTGTIPEDVGNLSELTFLSMAGNALTGTLPTTLGNLTSVQYMYLSTNSLSGSIPPELGNMTSLTALTLFDNQLTGSVPAELADATALDLLYIGDNSLSGALPSALGNLDMIKFDVRNNLLSGTIPSSFSNWINVEEFGLFGNDFEGPIPSGIGASLIFFDISNNAFSELPTITASSATTFNVSNNHFTFEDLEPNESVITLNTGQKAFGNEQFLYTDIGADTLLSPPLPGVGTSDSYYWERDGVVISGATESTLTLTNLQASDGGEYVLYVTNSQFPGLTLNSEPLNLWVGPLGDSCEGAIEATLGTNTTASAPRWFFYSPSVSYEKVLISSLGSGEDTYLRIYSACGGDLLAEHDDIDYPTYPESEAELILYDNDTIWIEWVDQYSSNGFDWTITAGTFSTTNVSDSLALVAFYNATDGTNWFNNSNWLLGPVETWFGVQTASGRVTELQLSGNNLGGSLPDEIGDLDQLQRLNLNINGITGAVPESIGNLINLEVLGLTNPISSLPESLGELNSLWGFNMANSLVTTIPDGLWSLPNLYDVRLVGNAQLEVTLPDTLGKNDALDFFWLDGSSLSGSLPCGADNTSLRVLRIQNMQMAADFPIGITQIPSLQELSLAGNGLTGLIPEELGGLTGLLHLDLGSNQFFGPIPLALTELTSLNYLSLFSNQLSGGIPPELGWMVSLTDLILSHNPLGGTIPPELGNLTNLTFLGLRADELTGTIPPELSALTNLNVFSVRINQLEGDVPSELANLTLLDEIHIESNLFTGLPDLSALSPSVFTVANNFFTFEDLAPNIGTMTSYSPQQLEVPAYDTILAADSELIIYYPIAGVGNTYQWIKNGEPIEGAVADSLVLTNVSGSDNGIYILEARNESVPNLTLTTDPFYVTIEGTGNELTEGPEWSYAYAFGETGARSNTAGMEVDAAENLLVYGSSEGTTDFFGQSIEGTGAFLAKLDANYNILWLTHLAGASAGAGIGDKFVHDKLSGANYVIGQRGLDELVIQDSVITSSVGSYNYFIAKLSASGSFLWIEEFPAQITLDDLTILPDGVLLSGIYPAGSLVVNGETMINQGSEDCFMIKYDADGNRVFVRTVGGSDIEYLCITAADQEGNIYLASEATSQGVTMEDGSQFPMADGDGNVLVVKYDHNGTRIWQDSYSGSSTTDYSSWPTSLTIDPFGNPVLKGWFGKKHGFGTDTLQSPFNYNKFLLQLSPEGTVNWAKGIMEQQYGFGYNEMETDAEGNIYVISDQRGDLYIENAKYPLIGNQDVYIMKYTQDGEVDWIKNATTTTGSSSLGVLAVVEEDNLYLGGSFSDPAFTLDDYTLSSSGISHGYIASIGAASLIPDSITLVAIYDATGGSDWLNNDNWLSGSVDTWYGVEVQNNKVIGLNLTGNQLNGVIPAEIGQLVNLKSVNLANNQLSNVDDSITTLPNLKALDLSGNDLVKLPAGLESMLLDSLAVSHNQLDFGALEALSGVLYEWSYAPQDSVGVRLDTVVSVGEDLILIADGGGTADSYTWKKDGDILVDQVMDSLKLLNLTIGDRGVYAYEVTNLLLPDLTLYGREVQLEVSSLEDDSLALLQIYDALDGANWTRLNNWRSGAPIADWVDVTVKDSRVIAVDLSENNLSGDFPEISSGLVGLDTLDISGNRVISLPDLSGLASLRELDASHNRLGFASLELNQGLSSLLYTPQDSIGIRVDTLGQQGSEYLLTREISGSANSYTWFKESLSDGGITELENTGPTLTINVNGFGDEGAYYAEVTSSIVTDITLVTEPIIFKVSSLERDSTALANMYASMNGASWAGEAANWPNESTIHDWFGVIIENERVTGLELPEKGLTGALGRDILDVAGLVSVDLKDNRITALPDFSALKNLTSLDVTGNHLEFDDLEKNMDVSGIVYDSQRPIGSSAQEIIPQGSDYEVMIAVGGTANSYEWTLTNHLGAHPVEDATGTLQVSGITYETMGEYYLEVTSSLVPNLTLTSGVYQILASADLTFNALDLNGNPFVEGTGYALRVNAPGIPYDTLGIVSGAEAGFVFDDLLLGDYLISVEPEDLEEFLPTYYPGTDLWVEAQVFKLRNDSTEVLKMGQIPPELPPLPEGGVVTGDVGTTLGDEEEGGRVEARRKVKRAGCSLRRFVRSGRIDQDGTFVLIAYVQSDDEGRFTFTDLESGLYRFNVEYPGIPMDPNSFVEFEIGADGMERNTFVLEATITENGIVVKRTNVLGFRRKYFKDLEVYPNPVEDMLTINYRNLVSPNVAARLMDMNGNLIEELTLKNGSEHSVELQMNQLPAGVYLLNFVDRSSNKGHIVSYRIIKQ